MPLGAFRLNTLGKVSSPPLPTFVAYSDPYAANLRLAMPFNSVTDVNDVSYLVSGSPNNAQSYVRPPSNPTYAEIVNNDFKFYNSSYNQKVGGGGTNKLYYDLTQSWFPHTTDYTIEFWIKTTRTLSNSWFVSNADIGGRYLFAIYDSGASTNSNISVSDWRIAAGNSSWKHIAIQRDYWYLNGVRKGTVSEPTLSGALSRLYIGAQKDGDNNDWEGYLNDFRLYIGINKYTGTTITPPGPMGEIV